MRGTNRYLFGLPFILKLCGAGRDMGRAANFVVGGKHMGKRKGRGGRMYGGEGEG